jgi:hypothetical protein
MATVVLMAGIESIRNTLFLTNIYISLVPNKLRAFCDEKMLSVERSSSVPGLSSVESTLVMSKYTHTPVAQLYSLLLVLNKIDLRAWINKKDFNI